MRTRFLFLLVLAAATLLTNVVRSANIAHGVEVVVIDAGHGGKFPGAHYGGVYEKDLTLKVALKVGRLIEQGMPGVKVVYTRKTDKELGKTLADDLQARADIANGAGGDLFISIHVNAARATAARGVETLIMGESPKEQRYNENALYESNREDLIDMSDERTAAIVRAYIQNLQFTYGEYSMALARFVQNNYISSGRHSRGVKPQLLRVLYATDMPGVLTEIGFMTNPQEMAYMKSEKGQNEIARNIYQAVRDYSDYVLKIRKSEGGAVPAEPAVPAEDTAREKPSPAPAPAKDTSRSVPSRPAAGEKQAPAAGQGAKAPAAEQPLRYAVQVMASSKAVPLSSPQFRSYRGKVKEYASEGRFPYKYCVGEYADRAAAQKRLREVRKTFPEAFVVSVQGGRVVK
ncbi:MAG TPA: N-acetylmuramoyl-L-alanine amidase [Candidatus Alistipes avistercoris]|nr:N-acetylmuramoyl-L-alanine amidase [Candidatus Alistipes avistercoris]